MTESVSITGRMLESLTGAAVAADPAGVGQGPWWVLLIPAMPLVATVLVTLCAMGRVKSKLPAWISVACLAVAFIVTAVMTMNFAGETVISTAFTWLDLGSGAEHGQRFVANFGFYVDSLTCLWMLFVTGLGALIALYASEYMAGEAGPGYCRFFAAFNLFVFAMSCLVMADNLVLLYLGWEGVGLCSYLLIGYFYKKPSAVEAAKKAFIVNRIGDLGLALGIMLTFVHFGTVEYKHLLPAVHEYVSLASQGRYDEIPFLVQLIPLLYMVGAFGKSAQFPLYVWLPDAMEGPTPVSALIHAATMVTAGVFLVCRTYWAFLSSEWALPIVAWVGAITALLAATIGMAQFDIKRIMAYSTVSQLGYMFAGLGVLTSVGSAFHVLTHAFFKALLFLACGAVMHGFAGQLDLRKLSGVRKMPGWGIVGVTMLVGCANLAGVPVITSGFFSKDMILAEAFVTPGYAMIGVILLITAGLTAYYTFRVYFRVFEGPVSYEPGDEVHGGDHGHDGHDAHAHDAHGETAHKHDAHTHDAHGKDDHAQEFHPHAPGWAINSVLVILATLATLAIALYFIDKPNHGWVGGMIHDSSAHYTSPWAHHAETGHSPTHPGLAGLGEAAETRHGVAGHPAGHREAGTFLGFDPHKAMYVVSGIVGLVGIFIAWHLHLRGRTTAATSRADALLPAMGPFARWAQGKWFVDEFYDWLIRRPLRGLAHVFSAFDKLFIDGFVNLVGFLPRVLASAIRPTQSGVLHGYALGMAGGIALLIAIVLLVTQ